MQNSQGARSKGFHKKGAKSITIPGTKPSIHNNTLLVSSGVPSLDALIGGGIAAGSCLLIDEDRYSTYSSLLLKYYLAEGVTNKHKLLVAAANQSPSQILQDLPHPITHTPVSSSESDDLSIAWRYKNVPSSEQSTYGHYYDITKVMSKEMVAAANAAVYDISSASQSSDGGHAYCDLLNKIQQTINEHKLSTAEKVPASNILRIGISSAGSPFWSDDADALPRFMFGLRALLRQSYATCLITVPGHLLHDLRGTIRFSDCSIQLISFSDNPEKYSKNPAFKEFHGLVKIHKLPCINSLVAHLPDTMDWVFKLKRKKLTIERMHLPPDLSETVSRSQEDPTKAKAAAASCGTTSSGVKIDF